MMTPDQTILIVEDSPEDYEATKRALRKSGLSNTIEHCIDGDEALDFLHQRGEFSEARRPGIILLDLNMPGTDGREVLQDIKSNDDLKMIPVIVLTTSNDERDIDACYKAGANSYVAKPVGLNDFLRAIQRLHDYWFEIVVIPKEGES